MKTLNERATEILQALLAVRAKKLKIKNASQTIHVKLIACIGKYNLISLTQHIEINGVLFRDPEVIFAFNTIKRQFIPYHYINDFFEIEKCCATPTVEGLIPRNEIDQHNLACFVNRWLLQLTSKLEIQWMHNE